MKNLECSTKNSILHSSSLWFMAVLKKRPSQLFVLFQIWHLLERNVSLVPEGDMKLLTQPCFTAFQDGVWWYW